MSDGNLYEKTGWVLDKELPPDYKYYKSNWKNREHKSNFRKARFRNDPKLKYEEGLTEIELSELNKIHRVWDSGKKRYIKEL